MFDEMGVWILAFQLTELQFWCLVEIFSSQHHRTEAVFLLTLNPEDPSSKLSVDRDSMGSCDRGKKPRTFRPEPTAAVETGPLRAARARTLGGVAEATLDVVDVVCCPETFLNSSGTDALGATPPPPHTTTESGTSFAPGLRRRTIADDDVVTPVAPLIADNSTPALLRLLSKDRF